MEMSAGQQPQIERHGDLERHGIDAVKRYLDRHGLSYEVIEHDPTFTAAADARACHVPADHDAKTVVLHDEELYWLAVVPASHRVDLPKIRRVISSDRELRLATEPEMADVFGQFDVGAVPPLGLDLFAAEVIDERLLAFDRILFTGGDHRHSVLVDPKSLAQAEQATVADIVEE